MAKIPLHFYLGYFVVLFGVIYGVELYLGSLYARYVIVYTGAVLLAGLIVGQRYERSWMARGTVGDGEGTDRQAGDASSWVARAGKGGVVS